jgi:hypothetical protein
MTIYGESSNGVSAATSVGFVAAIVLGLFVYISRYTVAGVDDREVELSRTRAT